MSRSESTRLVDPAAALDAAIAFEKSHRSPVSADATNYLEVPIGDPPARRDDEDPPASDMPGDPLELGEALANAETLPGEARHDELTLLKRLRDEEQARKTSTLRDLPTDVDPHDLRKTGWGLVLPAGPRGDDLYEALAPLVNHRQEQVADRWRLQRPGRPFADLPRYRPNTPPSMYLWDDLDMAPGVVDVDHVPYYLLIVGGPDLVPFGVQYALAVNHAVGRIAFDDRSDYGRWAQAVVDAENVGVSRTKRAALFAVRDGSLALHRLETHLVAPLAERLGDYMDRWPFSSRWPLDVRFGPEADKTSMLRELADSMGPGLALVAAHGLPLLPENPYQKAFQGAICCQRMPSDTHRLDRLLVASDIDALATADNPRPLHGLTAFLFACYGAGTPREDDFPQVVGGKHVETMRNEPNILAEAPFLAALPQAMLRQGALAVVGHVDRGWTLSFAWTLAGRTTEGVRSLEETLKQMVRGHRLGHALRALNRRHNAIASHLSAPLDQHRRGHVTDKRKLAIQWTAHHDARNTILLGDPAVYLSGQRLEGPGFCCDQWMARQTEPRSTLRSLPDPPDDAIVLSPDVQRRAEAEAERLGIDISSWVDSLIRSQVTRSPTLRG